MNTLTQPRQEWLIETLSRLPEQGKAEILNGMVVLMPPTGFLPGRASSQIFRSLRSYEEAAGGGYAIPDNVGMLVDLPNRHSFSPDASWHLGPATGAKFLTGAPAFAAEVRSEEDYGLRAEQNMAEKRTDYFAAGTQVVWDVDVLRNQTISVYHAATPDIPAVFGRDAVIDAEPAVPGWRFAVEDLFI